MTKDEALKLALEAIEYRNLDINKFNLLLKAAEAIREALAQPEPVIDKSAAERIATALGWEPKRKPLTDEEILSIARNHYNPHERAEISFARAIEAAHGIKEKNT